MSDNSLTKLIIHPYTDRSFKQEDKAAKFTIPVNPESLKKNCKIELENRKAHGTGANKPKFNSKGNEDVQFDFTLDGTKTIAGYDKELKEKPVQEQLDKFLKCVYDIAGEIHKPRFLILHWGKDFKFPCQLSSLNINYTLFDSDGSPLRIKISTTFVSYITPESSTAVNRLSSPDLSHYRVIGSSDRIDNLSHKIYNNPKYLLQIARVNGLTSFRRLKVGTSMTFPPLDKNNK